MGLACGCKEGVPFLSLLFERGGKRKSLYECGPVLFQLTKEDILGRRQPVMVRSEWLRHMSSFLVCLLATAVGQHILADNNLLQKKT